MSSVILTGDTSGTLTVSAPLVAGSNTLTLAAATGTLSPLVSATAQASTSGTSIDFTGIPSWAKRITVMFSGVSTNGTSPIIIQLGDSGGIETTGYVGWGTNIGGASVTGGGYTTGLPLNNTSVAANLYGGQIILSTLGSNSWAMSAALGASSTGSFGAGNKTLSDTLDRLRITTVNGTDTFDAGTINIMYEG